MIKKIQNYKNLFEKIKIKSNENYYASLLNKYNYDTKRTWRVMKEITGKQRKKSSSLPKVIKAKQRITKQRKRSCKRI